MCTSLSERSIDSSATSDPLLFLGRGRWRRRLHGTSGLRGRSLCPRITRWLSHRQAPCYLFGGGGGGGGGFTAPGGGKVGSPFPDIPSFVLVYLRLDKFYHLDITYRYQDAIHVVQGLAAIVCEPLPFGNPKMPLRRVIGPLRWPPIQAPLPFQMQHDVVLIVSRESGVPLRGVSCLFRDMEFPDTGLPKKAMNKIVVHDDNDDEREDDGNGDRPGRVPRGVRPRCRSPAKEGSPAVRATTAWMTAVKISA